MKNRTAKITIMNRTAGLILVPDEDGVDSFWKLYEEEEEGGEGIRGVGYPKTLSF